MDNRQYTNLETYDALRCAIIRQAVDDYKSALAGDTVAGVAPYQMIAKCEKFFRSDWCDALIGDVVDGRSIISRLRNAA